MSCGCGGLPPSVTLRIEAARLAMSAVGGGSPKHFRDMADEALSFLTDGLGEGGEAALDERAKKAESSGNTVHDRNRFINGPLSVMVSLRERAIETLEKMGIHTPGVLLQWDRKPVAEALRQTDMQALDAEIKARGLRFGLSPRAMREWITRGAA